MRVPKTAIALWLCQIEKIAIRYSQTVLAKSIAVAIEIDYTEFLAAEFWHKQFSNIQTMYNFLNLKGLRIRVAVGCPIGCHKNATHGNLTLGESRLDINNLIYNNIFVTA